MENDKKILIAYWKIRGLIMHVQYVAEYCKAPYETKYYQQGEAPTFDSSCWFDEKHSLGLDFPNLPYLFDGDFKMSETVPMMVYIAEKFRPEILGENTQEKATVSMITAVVHGAKNAVTGPCYQQDDKEKVLEAAWKNFKSLSKYLGDKKFFLGDKPTLPDFHFTELLNFIEKLDGQGTLKTKYENLHNLRNNVNELAEIKDFLSSDRCPDLPFNNVCAKVNC